MVPMKVLASQAHLLGHRVQNLLDGLGVEDRHDCTPSLLSELYVCLSLESRTDLHGMHTAWADGPIYAVKYVIGIHVMLIKRFFEEGEPATRVLALSDPRAEVDLTVGFTV